MPSFQCCFCGNTINEATSERLTMEFPLGVEEKQELYSHAFCIRRRLHRSVPLLLESETEIFVALLNEGTEVWRPVRAVPFDGEVFLLSPDQEIPSEEEWQFVPGQTVRCIRREFSGDKSGLAAVAIVDEMPNAPLEPSR